MNEVLDIIYTTNAGQKQCTINLSSLPTSVFESKEDFENFLIMVWESNCSMRYPFEDSIEMLPLVKISTCIYSKIMQVPKWYGKWDGKFYYEYAELN